MSSMIPYTPSPRPAAHIPAARQESGFYDDELPPELFDRDEDIEELAMYMHMAARIDE